MASWSATRETAKTETIEAERAGLVKEASVVVLSTLVMDAEVSMQVAAMAASSLLTALLVLAATRVVVEQEETGSVAM